MFDMCCDGVLRILCRQPTGPTTTTTGSIAATTTASTTITTTTTASTTTTTTEFNPNAAILAVDEISVSGECVMLNSSEFQFVK